MRAKISTMKHTISTMNIFLESLGVTLSRDILFNIRSIIRRFEIPTKHLGHIINIHDQSVKIHLFEKCCNIICLWCDNGFVVVSWTMPRGQKMVNFCLFFFDKLMLVLLNLCLQYSSKNLFSCINCQKRSLKL